ncbi:MAG: hypothetical protein R3A11_02890 [Bdellovibrionota bacterium]
MEDSKNNTKRYTHTLLQKQRMDFDHVRSEISDVLHNQLGSSLTSLLIQLQVIVDQSQEQKTIDRIQEVREQIRECYDIASTLHKKLKNDSMKNEFAEFYPWLGQKCSDLSEHLGVDIQVDIQEEEWEETLPFLANTTMIQLGKTYFGRATERVSQNIHLKISHQNNEILFSATDNCLSIEESKQEFEHLQKRIELMKGSFSIEHKNNLNYLNVKVGYKND